MADDQIPQNETEQGAPATEQGAETVTPPAPEGPPGWFQNYQSQHDQRLSQLQEKLSAAEQYNQQFQQQYQESQRQFQDRMLAALNPQLHQQLQQPRPATVDQLQQMFVESQKQAQAMVLAQRMEFDMRDAKQNYKRVFEYLPDAEEYLRQQWVASGKSVSQIAAEVDAHLSKQLEAHQKALVKDKEEMQQQIRGSGQKSGTVPPHEKPEPRGGPKGRSRLVSLMNGRKLG